MAYVVINIGHFLMAILYLHRVLEDSQTGDLAFSSLGSYGDIIIHLHYLSPRPYKEES